MIGTTISHYKITEKIGVGGMGVVYKAHDTKLDRYVALKFLPHEFTMDEESVQRFINEAKTASALQHNNICTIHEIGGSEEVLDGRQFICMDYYEGETLKQILDRGPENYSGISDIMMQLAEGLRAAHQKEIIHRDIKPSNIFITKEGTVKILDFGLAKGLDAAQFTNYGTTAGTASYMSPEQLTGSTADKRTDIWSFGVVLFEMLCGARPFTGEIEHAIIYSIVNEEPDWQLLEAADVHKVMKDIVRKCLEKNPGKRYQSIDELLYDLKSLDQTTAGSLISFSRRQINNYGEVIRKAFRGKIIRFILAAAVLILFFFMYQNFNRTIISTDMHLAVLPIDCGEYPDGEKICTGLHKYLIGQITEISYSTGLRNSGKNLTVVPSSDINDNKIVTTSDAITRCNANYTISIALINFQDYIDAYIELIDAEDSDKIKIISSGHVQDSTKNWVSLQKDIAIKISSMLDIWSEEVISIAEAGITYEEDAYEKYLQAISFLEDFELIDNINNAIGYFSEAAAIDTNYSLAYAGLAEAYFRKYDNEKNIQYADSSTKFSYKALSKDPGLYEAHVSLGIVHRMKGLYEEAVNDFNKAIEINKYNDAAYRELNRVYNKTGRHDLAEQTISTAIKINPGNWANYNSLGVTYYIDGKLGRAKRQFKKVVELRPYNVKGYANLAGIYFLLDQPDSAINAVKKSNEIEPTLNGYNQLGAIYFNLRRFDEAAEMLLAALEFSETDYEVWGSIGECYYWSDRKDEAVEYFKKAIEFCGQQLEVNPKNTYDIVNLAGYYSRLGDEEAALKELRKAARYGITDYATMYTAASTYELIGNRGKALEWLKKALDAGSSTAEIENYPGFDELRKDKRYGLLVNP